MRCSNSMAILRYLVVTNYKLVFTRLRVKFQISDFSAQFDTHLTDGSQFDTHLTITVISDFRFHEFNGE